MRSRLGDNYFKEQSLRGYIQHVKKDRHSKNLLCLGNHCDLHPQAVLHTLCHAGSYRPGLTVGNLGFEDSGHLQCREGEGIREAFSS